MAGKFQTWFNSNFAQRTPISYIKESEGRLLVVLTTSSKTSATRKANKEILSAYTYSQVAVLINIFVRKISFKLSVGDDPVVGYEKSHVVGYHAYIMDDV